MSDDVRPPPGTHRRCLLSSGSRVRILPGALFRAYLEPPSTCRGSQKGSPRRRPGAITQTTGKRRGHGEDSICWQESKNRYVGVVSLGFSACGARLRTKGQRADQGRGPGQAPGAPSAGGGRAAAAAAVYRGGRARGLAGAWGGRAVGADRDLVPRHDREGAERGTGCCPAEGAYGF